MNPWCHYSLEPKVTLSCWLWQRGQSFLTFTIPDTGFVLATPVCVRSVVDLALICLLGDLVISWCVSTRSKFGLSDTSVAKRTNSKYWTISLFTDMIITGNSWPYYLGTLSAPRKYHFVRTTFAANCWCQLRNQFKANRIDFYIFNCVIGRIEIDQGLIHWQITSN